MPSTVNTPSAAHPVRPLPTREPLPDTLARPPIHLAWKEESGTEAVDAVSAEAAGSAVAPPIGAVSRLLTTLAARLITR